MSIQVYNPLTGAIVYSLTMNSGDHYILAQGPQAYIIKGIFTDVPGGTEVSIDLGSPDMSNCMIHVPNDDGDTTPASIGGRSCRRNVNPAEISISTSASASPLLTSATSRTCT